MAEVGIIGRAPAKNAFQAHVVGADRSVIFRCKVFREPLLPFLVACPRCIVAMEACAGAPHWGCEIERLGHRVRLIPAQYAKIP